MRHGDPFRREGSFDAGQISSVFYRPEKHDGGQATLSVFRRSVTANILGLPHFVMCNLTMPDAAVK